MNLHPFSVFMQLFMKSNLFLDLETFFIWGYLLIRADSDSYELASQIFTPFP